MDYCVRIKFATPILVFVILLVKAVIIRNEIERQLKFSINAKPANSDTTSDIADKTSSKLKKLSIWKSAPYENSTNYPGYISLSLPKIDLSPYGDEIKNILTPIHFKPPPVSELFEPFQEDECPFGHFSKNNSCHEWLGCDEIERISRSKKVIGRGFYKTVSKIFYGKPIAYNENNIVKTHRNPKFMLDMDRSIKHMIFLQNSKYVPKLYGFCAHAGKRIFLTELATEGTLLNHITSDEFTSSSLETKLDLIISLAKAFEFMHHSPIGTRFNCDLSEWPKFAKQFLVSENRVMMNDIDDIPDIGINTTANCMWGRRHYDFTEGFSSPEEKEFNSKKGPDKVTHKADIYKIAKFVLKVLPSESEHLESEKFVQSMLDDNPATRPAIEEVVTYFEHMLDKIKKKI